jgi:hypothetical protein
MQTEEAIDDLQTPSQHVLEVIASNEGVKPWDLTPCLYDAVDPEALDAIIESYRRGNSDGPLQITFGLGEYHVRVCVERDVLVVDTRPRDQVADANSADDADR